MNEKPVGAWREENWALPLDCSALPPSVGAASNAVPLTVTTFILSVDFSVCTALPNLYKKYLPL